MRKIECISGNCIDIEPKGESGCFDFSRLDEVIRITDRLNMHSTISVQDISRESRDRNRLETGLQLRRKAIGNLIVTDIRTGFLNHARLELHQLRACYRRTLDAKSTWSPLVIWHDGQSMVCKGIRVPDAPKAAAGEPVDIILMVERE
jgi:hypothetical protein